jgi:DNA transformation protein
MSEQQDFATHIVDLLEPFGYCEARRMFGGYGIFHQGLMFGQIADGSLYLKADAESREVFVTEGGRAFSYFKGDREYQLSYYLAADDFFEDDVACLARISHHPSTAATLCRLATNGGEKCGLAWARLAFDAALRNPARHKKKKS